MKETSAEEIQASLGGCGVERGRIWGSVEVEGFGTINSVTGE